jgi:hypothetical protein
MVFQAIPSKFLCATFQKPSNTSHFVPLFLAHEDIVVGFVIFHTKLSTPRLGSFICSSLILQGSWLDHHNLKKEKKKALLDTSQTYLKFFMLHACFYTICLVFHYTLWHFYAFSGTNLLTRCHSASSLFSAIF